MRLHTDLIKIADVYAAAKNLPGVYITVTEHRSRSRDRAFEISLEGNGYRKNTGSYGASDVYGATWDEWGVVIARLYALDPDAFWGSAKYQVYQDQDDFNWQTAFRFENHENLPEDTHKRHTWRPTGIVGKSECAKCSAIRKR